MQLGEHVVRGVNGFMLSHSNGDSNEPPFSLRELTHYRVLSLNYMMALCLELSRDNCLSFS